MYGRMVHAKKTSGNTQHQVRLTLVAAISSQSNSVLRSFLSVLFCLLVKLTHREGTGSKKCYGIKRALEHEATLEE